MLGFVSAGTTRLCFCCRGYWEFLMFLFIKRIYFTSGDKVWSNWKTGSDCWRLSWLRLTVLKSSSSLLLNAIRRFFILYWKLWYKYEYELKWIRFDQCFFFSQTEYISVHHSTAIFIEVTYPLLSTFIFHRYFSFKTHRNIIHLLLFKRSQFNYVLYPPFHEDITWCTQNDTRSIKLDYVET